MKLSYEKACIEAGLDEEKIKEIRKVFDLEKNKLRQERKRLEGSPISMILNLSSLLAGEMDETVAEVPDPSFDLEEIVIHNIQQSELNECLGQLSEGDRKFILECFDSELSLRRISDAYGLCEGTVRYRKKKIIEELRKMMEVKIYG